MFHIVLQSFHTASISESQPLVLRFRMNEWSDKELRRENIRQTSLILVSKIDHDSELMFSDLVPIQLGCFMMMMLGLEGNQTTQPSGQPNPVDNPTQRTTQPIIISERRGELSPLV